ncbi:hypothetical protein ACIA5C_22080 [Actinoplanes sp. NPDC051343]|uniref:hypothetical protein n=1 Tax=Actinoplanes sp. NPDC051343 TaxID=3363906 RepID=UPI00378FB1F5
MSYDIQDVLESVRGGAPAPHTTTDDIIARAKRRRTRRRLGITAAGIAACLGIVMTATLLPGGTPNMEVAGEPIPSGPTGPRPIEKALPIKHVDFSSTLGSYRAGAYQVGPAGQVAAGYQQMPVYKDGETWEDDDTHVNYPYAGSTLTVYAPGVYDPGSFAFGEDATLKIGDKYTVKIGDRPGFAIDFTYSQPGNESNKFVRTALAWQYRTGAWATLVPNYEHGPLPRADAIQIAAGLITSARKQQLKVPYKLGYLPKGWQAVAVTQTPVATSTSLSTLILHPGPEANPALLLDESAPSTVVIGVSRARDTKEHLVEGLNCFPGRQECTIVHGDYLIGVGSWDQPDAVVKKIAEGLKLKDLSDPSTWVVPNA